MQPKSYYRADIDGLRAFAVIAVILYHLDIPGFPGGFVGVDVFFVLSGYLITSIIRRELNEGTFSLVKFWERRVRRIIPAMAVVIGCTTVASYFITLYPIDFKDFGLSLSAQSVFAANFYFMRLGEYFATPPDTMPLLHTWTLAVEEQFYVLFPLLMLAAFYWLRNKITLLLGAILLLSFGLSFYLSAVAPDSTFTIPFLPHLWGGATNASAGFYFLPARAWELLIGTLLAVIMLPKLSPKVAEVVAAGAFLVLVGSFVLITDEMAFPGLVALFPVLATALIITANQHQTTFAKQLLSFRLFVGIGLLSYSLYLWHWPIIVLAKQYWIGSTFEFLNWFVVPVTAIFSLLTYHYIETPFRTKQIMAKRTTLFASAFGTAATFCLIGAYIYTHDGLPKRAPASAEQIAAAATDFNPQQNECFKNPVKQINIINGGDPCFLGNVVPTDKIDFVLWGDSHSDAIMPAFAELANDYNVTGATFVVGGCIPLLSSQPISKDEICNSVKGAAVAYIRAHDIKHIFLVANWKNEYTAIGNQESLPLLQMLTNTVAQLPPDTSIYIVKTVPMHPEYEVRRDFYETIRNSTFEPSVRTLSDHEKQVAAQTGQLTQLSDKNTRIEILDPAIVLCNNRETCDFIKNKIILYRDDSHLTATGARHIKPLFEPIFIKLNEE